MNLGVMDLSFPLPSFLRVSPHSGNREHPATGPPASGPRPTRAPADGVRFRLAVIDFIDLIDLIGLAAKPGVNRAMEKIVEKRLALRGNGK